MARSNRSKRIKVDKEQAGGSPAYTLHGEQGLLSGTSFGYTPLPLTVHGAGFSDHIVSTSGGGRKARRSRARRSSPKRASGARRANARRSSPKRASSARRSSARRSSPKRANARRSSARRASSARRSSPRRSSPRRSSPKRASGVNNNPPPPYNIVTQNHKNKINKKESMIPKYLYNSGPNLNLVQNSIKLK